MIEFINEDVKKKFEALPENIQKDRVEAFLKHLKAHEVLTIQCVDYWGPDNKFLEISIRIDEKL